MNAEEVRSLTYEQVLPVFDSQLAYWREKTILGMEGEDIEQEIRIVIWKCYKRVCDGFKLKYQFDTYTCRAIRNRILDLLKATRPRVWAAPLDDSAEEFIGDNRDYFSDAEFRADIGRLPLSQDARGLLESILSGRIRKVTWRRHAKVVAELVEAGLLDAIF